MRGAMHRLWGHCSPLSDRWGFPGGSAVKSPPAMRRGFDPQVRKIPEEDGGAQVLQSMGLQLDTTE